MLPFRTAVSVVITLILASAMLVACQAAPPVQEMSDARQAIAVARESGAVDLAAAELLEAERFLKRAEQSLTLREYAQAREAAMQARDLAHNVQRMTEADLDRRYR
ncbi:MAG: hypothetical protein AAGA44_10505 [Pseudomonadota bacterium]